MSSNTSKKKSPAKKPAKSKAAPEQKPIEKPIHHETIQAPYHFSPDEIGGMNIDTLRPFTTPAKINQPADEKFRSIIDSAKRDFNDREKLMEHFRCMLADYPSHYPGGDSEHNFNKFVADIRQCIDADTDATKL